MQATARFPVPRSIAYQTQANDLDLHRPRGGTTRHRQPASVVVAVDAVVVARPPVAAVGLQRAEPEPPATAAITVSVGAIGKRHSDGEAAADVAVVMSVPVSVPDVSSPGDM